MKFIKLGNGYFDVSKIVGLNANYGNSTHFDVLFLDGKSFTYSMNKPNGECYNSSKAIEETLKYIIETSSENDNFKLVRVIQEEEIKNLEKQLMDSKEALNKSDSNVAKLALENSELKDKISLLTAELESHYISKHNFSEDSQLIEKKSFSKFFSWKKK